MRTLTLTNGLLNNFFNDWDWDLDHKEREEDYNIELNLAGIKKENIDVSLDGDILKIKAEQDNKNYFKSYLVPSKADRDKVLVKHEDGMLYVTFVKREGEKSKKIAIN
ncbi:hypothetical protein CL634_05980 [bacterium]|nr:hypothetical protein [bacterium]|tara:strand:+ start:4835 stop:5158 length:324 start_codon:yes stop_codon:yes gene_type:complete